MRNRTGWRQRCRPISLAEGAHAHRPACGTLGEPAEAARLLLRGEEIKTAERWQLSRPRSAPEVTPTQQAFVAASRTAETRRLRRTVWMSLTAAVAAIALTLGALWQRSLAIAAREDADTNRAKAEHNLDTAIDTSTSSC